MKKALFLLLFLFSSWQLWAQTPSKQKNDTINLNEVVVTGSPIQVNKTSVPLAVTVISHQQITESTESNVLPLLNGRVPGLFVTERGVTGFGVATGAAGQISIRGIGGSPTTGVLMLIDGHPQFMGIFGHPLADSYVTSDVERVEVIRGPASILYGSNAMGGVINIITRKQNQNGFRGNINLMYGSYNTQKYMASAGYKKNKLSFYVSFNHDQTDGHRPHSDFSINNGYTKLNYEINNHWNVSTDFSLARFKASDPGPDTLAAVPGNRLDISRGYWAVDVKNSYKKVKGVTQFFYNFGTHKISDGFLSHDLNYGLNIHQSARLFQGNNISIGAEYINYGGKAENELAMNGNGIIFIDTTVYEAAAYAFIQQRLYKRLTLNAGLRIEHHKIYGNIWVPGGGLAWQINGNSAWKISVSKGFRSPTIQELFLWNHNPDLKPEQVMDYESSFLQSFAGKRISLELTAFIIKGNNLIINVPYQGLENAGKIDNKGIEMAVNTRLNQNLNGLLTYSFTHMKNPVYATPRHHLFVGANYKIKKFTTSLNMEYVNHLDTDPSTAVYYQTYTLLNVKMVYQALKFVEIYVSGENLLNQHYETNRYYPMPGTVFFAGIHFKYSRVPSCSNESK